MNEFSRDDGLTLVELSWMRYHENKRQMDELRKRMDAAGESATPLFKAAAYFAQEATKAIEEFATAAEQVRLRRYNDNSNKNRLQRA